MSLTLWRGEQLLGELVRRPARHVDAERRAGESPSFSGFLIRATNAAPLEGVWQVKPRLPGFGLLQHALKPDIVAERYRNTGSSNSDAPVERAWPVTADAPPAVLVEHQLTIRDASGRVYLPQSIAIRESRFEPKQFAGVLREAPAEALVNGVLWTIHAVFMSEIDSPEQPGTWATD